MGVGTPQQDSLERGMLNNRDPAESVLAQGGRGGGIVQLALIGTVR